MVKKQTVNKGVIVAEDCKVDTKKFYTAVKGHIEDMGYDFSEKAQEQEINQYGGKITIEFNGEKELRDEDFVKKKMNIKAVFSDIKKGHCKVKILYKFELYYDFKNKWDTNKFNRFLYHLWDKYFVADKLKKQFFVPTLIQSEKFVKFLKETLQFHYK